MRAARARTLVPSAVLAAVNAVSDEVVAASRADIAAFCRAALVRARWWIGV